MPFSSENGKWAIDRVVNRFVAEDLKLGRKQGHRLQILDIGVGCGTYKDRYADLLPSDIAEWTGVEVWEPYVQKYRLDKKYENLYVMDVNAWINPHLDKVFNIAFVGDVLEHMTKEQAETLIDYLCLKCQLVIIAIPIVHYPQSEFDGNPYEAHVKDDWSHTEVMETFPCIVEWACEQDIGVYFLSEDTELVKRLCKPRIGVYGICKNEEKTIERTIESIKDSDAVVLCDTGSTDRTLSKLATYVSDTFKVFNINVLPWRFDEARNVAMMLSPADLDLLVSIDMDEYMQAGWYQILADEVQTHIRTNGRPYDLYHHRFRTEWDWQQIGEGQTSESYSSHWHSRIHTRHNWRWSLPVHEILESTGKRVPVECFLGGLMMYQRPITKETRANYLPLLEISIRERPDVWKSWFFYASELFHAERREDAIKALHTALEKPGADKAHLYNALASYEKDEAKILGYFMQACTLGNQREYWAYLAWWCHLNGKKGLAKEAFENALRFTTPSSGYSFNPTCWNESFYKLANEVLEKKNG